MSPWHLIWEGTGWLVVGLIAFFVLVKAFYLANAGGQVIGYWIAYRRTRNVPPAVGQWWEGGGYGYYKITRIIEAGAQSINGVPYGQPRVVWQSGDCSSSDSLDEWKKRVKFRRLRLEIK